MAKTCLEKPRKVPRSRKPRQDSPEKARNMVRAPKRAQKHRTKAGVSFERPETWPEPGKVPRSRTPRQDSAWKARNMARTRKGAQKQKTKAGFSWEGPEHGQNPERCQKQKTKAGFSLESPKQKGTSSKHFPEHAQTGNTCPRKAPKPAKHCLRTEKV